MSTQAMWDCEDSIASMNGIEVPRWIEQDISPSQVAAILQGGCASGAYMPAVTYHTARKIMDEHGDQAEGVMDYLQDVFGALMPRPEPSESWAGMAVFYLSAAVELWCSNIEEELERALEEIAQDAP